jgi:hypothetical protein
MLRNKAAGRERHELANSGRRWLVFEPQPPRCAPRHRRPSRTGLSLIEALISIFIVSIGLLGVVALFTIGHHDALGGAVADHAALVGREKLRDFRVRGMDDPDNWLSGTTRISNLRLPYCIDPRFVAAGLSNRFPLSGGIFIPRISLWTGMNDSGTGLPIPLGTLAADEIFMSQDDLAFNDPDDADLLPVQIFAGASNSKRASDGRYSWMATIVPQLDVSGAASAISDQQTLSIVVFYQRPAMVAGPDSNFERAVSVTFLGGGYGGGDVTLTTPTTSAALLNDIGAGQWILVAANVSGNGYFQWYRLTSVSDVYGDPTSSSRDVTLIGADWDTGALGGEQMSPVEGTIVTGVVAVYEQTIRLKRSSLWLD